MPQPAPGPDARPALDALTAGGGVLPLRDADVGVSRETSRRGRFVKLALAVWAVVALAWWRALTMDAGGAFLPLPHVDPFLLTIVVFFGLLMAMAVGQQVLSARSPHVTYRPSRSTSVSTTSSASTA